MPTMAKSIIGLLSKTYPGQRVELVRYANDGSGEWRESDLRTLQARDPKVVEADAKGGGGIQVRSYLRVWNEVDGETTCSHIPFSDEEAAEGLFQEVSEELGDPLQSGSDRDKRSESTGDFEYP